MTAPASFLVDHVDDVVVIGLHSEIGDFADDRILDEMRQLVSREHLLDQPRVIVDLKDCEYFGSIVLEALRGLWNAVHERSGQMVICNASPVCSDILHVARFDTLWPLVKTREDALERIREVQQ